MYLLVVVYVTIALVTVKLLLRSLLSTYNNNNNKYWITNVC